MKTIHGHFNSFQDLALAMRIKSKGNKQENHKCKNCGQPLRYVPGTNVWMCDFVNLEDKELNGKPVQVFTKCGNVVFSKE